MQPKKYLLIAIEKLIREKGIENIIVQDILIEAGVSRATFYKYFWDKYDLANAYYSEYVRENILPYYDGTNWRTLLAEILLFIRENEGYFRSLIDLSTHSFSDFLTAFGEEGYRQNYLINTGKKELSPEDQYALEFYNAGCVRVICCWLKSGCTEAPEQIADLILQLMPEEYHTLKHVVSGTVPDLSHLGRRS